MADYLASTAVSASADDLFAYLSDVHNLPKYMDRMTSAEPAEGEAVDVTADLGNGHQVEGEAWFHVDDEARALSWGSEGPDDYSGRLHVAGDDSASTVTVTLSTERVEGEQIQAGLDRTVARIKELVEGR